jgi:preprotein translocase subunit YajC
MISISSIPFLMAPPSGNASADSTQSLFTMGSLLLVFVVFYFMMIRPQNKKQKETERMLKALKKGDRVQTIGGLRGVVVSTKEDSVILKVDDDTKMEFVRSAIASVLEQKAVEEAKVIADSDENAK